MEKKKVALVYDRVNSQGGAEKILQELHALYPEAPLFTSVYESASAPWARGWDIRPSFLQHVPFFRTRHQLLGWLMPFVFEAKDLREFDLIISVTSEFAKAVITQPHQKHICYLLTPTRYLWSHSQQARTTIPSFLRPLADKAFALLRAYDKVVAQRPDALISISGLVAQRAKEYYGRESHVFSPPFSALPAEKEPEEIPPFPEFVLTWGRLVAYKQFDRVVDAAIRLQLPLVIIGDGPERARLAARAHNHPIHFAGYQDEAQLAWFLGRARVAVFPQIEDFGIAPLEAWLHGTPILVQRSSGSSELLKDEKNVHFLDGENSENLELLLKKVWESPRERLDIPPRARQYAGERWRRDWSSLVERV